MSQNAIRETDIRPDSLMPRAFELLEEDTRHLMQRAAEFVRVGCPACGAAQHRLRFEKRGMTFVECLACETVFGNPRPTPEILRHYYETATYYEYWNRYVYPASEAVRRERIFRPRVEAVLRLAEKYAVSLGTLLEVGPGHGLFCDEMSARRAFRRILTIEPTPSLAESCRKRGIEVIQQPVEQAIERVRDVDVVVSFEVIEHLFDPREFVAACARLLRPGGVLLLTCPNIKGFDLQVLGAAADGVTPEHLNYFHSASLAGLVERCGLQVLETSTPGRLDADIVRKKLLAGKVDLSGQPFLRQLLTERWDDAGAPFQEFLASHRLSSHLWLVARTPARPH